MDPAEALDVIRATMQGSTDANTVTDTRPALELLEGVLRRAGQVEGGHYLKYARADEVARWIRTGNREGTE